MPVYHFVVAISNLLVMVSLITSFQILGAAISIFLSYIIASIVFNAAIRNVFDGIVKFGSLFKLLLIGFVSSTPFTILVVAAEPSLFALPVIALVEVCLFMALFVNLFSEEDVTLLYSLIPELLVPLAKKFVKIVKFH
ncbi:MAG: hypothetical protein ACFFD4_18940 [Candidatus Odinarchaeota archaeon]